MKRKATDAFIVKLPKPKRRQTRKVTTTIPKRMFVARSFGTPLAVTERKYYDKEYASPIVGTTTSWAGCEADPATQLCLIAPTQGDDFNNRQGRKIHVLAIKLRGQINCAPQANQTAGEFSSIVRVCLVQDKQTNTAQLNAEDVISSGAASSALHMFQNPAFFGRFKVLKDKMYTLQNPAISWDGTNIEQNGLDRSFKMTIKFKKPVIVHFNATNGGTIADIVDNSFHVICNTNSTGLVPNLIYKSRVVFVDI